jgi:hypothetical protein
LFAGLAAASAGPAGWGDDGIFIYIYKYLYIYLYIYIYIYICIHTLNVLAGAPAASAGSKGWRDDGISVQALGAAGACGGALSQQLRVPRDDGASGIFHIIDTYR